jgi:hypothetical protein
MTEDWGRWEEGFRYEARMDYGNLLWHDQGQYHGRMPVQIRDRMTGKVFDRIGDVKIIGNFSPIFVTIMGYPFQVTELLRMEEPVTREYVRNLRYQEELKKKGKQHYGPKAWRPRR